jgi:hypothetical protein
MTFLLASVFFSLLSWVLACSVYDGFGTAFSMTVGSAGAGAAITFAAVGIQLADLARNFRAGRSAPAKKN